MNINEIKELAVLLEEFNLSKIKVKENDKEITLEKEVQVLNTQVALPNIVENTSNIIETNEVVETINSPIVGTFYSRPNPDAKAYVSANQQVKAGDIICIVEAMKVMNEIKADVDCIIKEVLVKDGEIVEFDQPLFMIG